MVSYGHFDTLKLLKLLKRNTLIQKELKEAIWDNYCNTSDLHGFTQDAVTTRRSLIFIDEPSTKSDPISPVAKQ